MDRRLFLQLVAAAAAAGCTPRDDASKPLRVVVAGAGIVGASIAYQLSKAGAAVTVIDKTGPASHASGGTFAWMNATWAKTPREYHSLNQDSVTDWATLAGELGLPVRWGGSLEWFESEARQDRLAIQIAEQAEWGERARMVNAAELATLEPNVEFHGATRAAFSENDGTVDPIVATNLMLEAAVKLGATLKFPCELADVTLQDGRLAAVETDQGAIAADRLVLATGASPDAPKRFADSPVPQRSTPGIIAITAPMPRVLNRIVVAPGIHMHQRDDGRVVLGEQDGAPQTEAHAMRLESRPNAFPASTIAAEHARRMLAVATHFAPALADATAESIRIGWRPLPLDGHPVIGASPARPDVYLAIMHSGVSLAPIAGQLAATEIVGRTSVPRLDSFRPGREFIYNKLY